MLFAQIFEYFVEYKLLLCMIRIERIIYDKFRLVYFDLSDKEILINVSCDIFFTCVGKKPWRWKLRIKIVWPITKTSLTSLVFVFCIIIGFFNKNNRIAWNSRKFSIRSFGIGCWIRWARWLLRHWKLQNLNFSIISIYPNSDFFLSRYAINLSTNLESLLLYL